MSLVELTILANSQTNPDHAGNTANRNTNCNPNNSNDICE